MRKKVMYPLIALLIILIALSCLAIVWTLIPKFLEQPKYTVKESYKNFEIREYDTVIFAKTSRTGNQYESLRNGFSPLARFIGAKERDGEKISMTVPVFQQRNSSTDSWNIYFSMPKKYEFKDLPQPKNPEVSFENRKIGVVASVTFSGNANEKLLTKKENELKNWLNAKGYNFIGNPFYLFYNDPLTPSFLRKNEVFFQIQE